MKKTPPVKLLLPAMALLALLGCPNPIPLRLPTLTAAVESGNQDGRAGLHLHGENFQPGTYLIGMMSPNSSVPVRVGVTYEADGSGAFDKHVTYQCSVTGVYVAATVRAYKANCGGDNYVSCLPGLQVATTTTSQPTCLPQYFGGPGSWPQP